MRPFSRPVDVDTGAAPIVLDQTQQRGAAGATPLLARFRSPVEPSRSKKRWLEGLYLDTPEEWDDPYRFFRW